MHPPCLTSRVHHNRYRCCLSISYASRRCHFTPRSRRLIIRLSSTHPISLPSFDLHTSPPLCSVHCFSLRFVFVRVICGQSHSLFYVGVSLLDLSACARAVQELAHPHLYLLSATSSPSYVHGYVYHHILGTLFTVHLFDY